MKDKVFEVVKVEMYRSNKAKLYLSESSMFDYTTYVGTAHRLSAPRVNQLIAIGKTGERLRCVSKDTNTDPHTIMVKAEAGVLYENIFPEVPFSCVAGGSFYFDVQS